MCLKALPKTRIMNLSVFSTCFCLLVSYVAAVENTVPVFMLDYDQVMLHVQVNRNPLKKVTSDVFAKIVEESSKYKVIIFLEDTFSVEDISTKDKVYGTPFKNLQANLLMDKNKVKYFPSVVQPSEVLRKTFPPKDDNVFNVAQRTKLQLKDSLKYIYMHFQDSVKETKVDKLKIHDTIIREVMGALHVMKIGPIIAYYTGKLNPVSVKKMEGLKVSTDSKKEGFSVKTPRVLFLLYGVHTTQQTRRFYYEQQPTVIEEIPSKHQLSSKMSLDNVELKWQFTFYTKNWIITDVFLYEGTEAVGHFSLNAGANHNQSYFCDEPIHILNVRDGSHLTINSMLIDAANQNAAAKGLKYHSITHCSPLYSSASLSCFVCAGVFLCILAGGVTFLMDCSSNDRCEDPSSKPLTHERMH